MSRSALQIPSSVMQIDDPKSPRSPTSFSPSEKDYLKPSIVDSQVVLRIGEMESVSPSNTPPKKGTLHYLETPRKKTQPSPETKTEENVSQAPISRAVVSQSPNTVSIMPNLRVNFMRKVFAILFLQLCISGAAIGITFFPSLGVRDFMATNLPLAIVMAVLSLGSLLILTCKRQACRKVPRNYILLLVYTISISYLLGTVAATTESNIVLYAGGATIAVVFAITLYACIARTNLSPKGMGITTLFTTITILLVVGIALRGPAIGIVLSGLIAFAFGIHLTINIQKLTGKYEVQYSLDDYIIASLDIYVDILQIFVAILNIFKKVMV